ncbi:MAG TPA: sulfite exporter TauE/SafE family protein [Vicinamibacterales bacterium]|nr:sulfite exporter TauE/SafE family protein [Vicinamibacterales bacterium]
MSAATIPLLLSIMAAGGLAGCLGALLGIGGGVFLVPFLNVVLGLDIRSAAGISLMTVIATSTIVSGGAANRHVINLRLGLLLQIPAIAGGLLGAETVEWLTPRTLYVIFACVTGIVALVMLTRLDRRNVILDDTVSPGALGGRYYEQESGRDVVYRLRRLPAALGIAFSGGILSGLLGIGGGILQVPALNAWCGVPMRAAAAMTAAMIGITALGSAPIYYARGRIAAPLAAAAVIGVIAGSRAGLWMSPRAKARWLKLLMAAVLALVSSAYFYRSFTA